MNNMWGNVERKGRNMATAKEPGSSTPIILAIITILGGGSTPFWWSSVFPPQVSSTMKCFAGVEGTLDDNKDDTSGSYYTLDISVKGSNVFSDTVKNVFQPGEPYGGPFKNWIKLEIKTPVEINEGEVVSFSIKLKDTKELDFIAINSIFFKCNGGKNYWMKIEDRPNRYGPRGERVGIINFGSSMNKNFPINNDFLVKDLP
jgi:hypothetical protein